MLDHFLDEYAATERLIREWEKYGRLVIAYDFDNTVYDYHGGGYSYSMVIDLLRKCKEVGAYFICFTARENDELDFVWKYLKDNNIPVDKLNDNPDFLPFNGRKIYYNILLDDRAGLAQAYNMLSYAATHMKAKRSVKRLGEEWRPIEGYEGLYEVSNLGRVKSLARTIIRSDGRRCVVTEKILTERVNDRGYIEIKLSRLGSSTYKKLHRIVATAFLDNPENKPEVNHKDGNKKNNQAENLEWATHSENMQHAFANGLHSHQGDRSSTKLLTESDVLSIRERQANGEKRGEVYADYAEVISIHGFKAIWYRHTWKHI